MFNIVFIFQLTFKIDANACIRLIASTACDAQKRIGNEVSSTVENMTKEK